MRVGKHASARVVRPHAFTRTDLLVTILLIVIVLAIMLPGIQPYNHRAHRQLKDRTQLRGIAQGLVLWSQNHDDRFPLPSELDPDNTTAAAPGSRKDTTANIMSILIFEGYVPPEILISPVETNGNIGYDTDYTFDAPPTAVNPEIALWDPAFNADFRDLNRPGNVSYAHLLPFGERLNNWKNTSNATTAVLANRGPEITAIEPRAAKPPSLTYANPDTYTFTFHGSRRSWSGNVGFADVHVDLWDGPSSESNPYTFDAGPRPDVLFYDEPDDAAHLNAFLGIFVEPADDAEVQQPIWD